MAGIDDFLDWAYEKAVDGIPGLDSAGELAEEYLKGPGTIDEKIDSLINWQSMKCGTSGFLTNVGGFLSFTAGLAANLSSVIYLQLRMVAAIAHMRGYDVKDERVKAMAVVCLCGNSANKFIKEAVGIGAKKSVTKGATKKLFARMTPVIGGIVGGVMDAGMTKAIGTAAKNTFVEKKPEGEIIVESVEKEAEKTEPEAPKEEYAEFREL